MPNTTNNNWPTPADTDLVKNGASAIRALGNAIDTTLGVYGAAGLTLVSATTFSAVSSQSFTLSTTYDNYKILLNDLTGSTTSINLNFRLRNSAGDISGANYRWAYSRMFTGGSSPTGTGGSGTTNSTWLVFADGPLTSAEVTLNNMSGTNVKPSYSGIGESSDGVNGTYVYHFGNHYNADVTPTGFTLYTSTGTMSGTVRIYGFKKTV